MSLGAGIQLDSSKWEAFLRGLDRASLNEFRKGLRRSSRELQKAIRLDWSGGLFQRRTGRSAKSIRLRVPTVNKILSGRPIESQVFSKRFVIRLHESGYDFKRTRGGRIVKHMPGRHSFETRTHDHADRHKRIMEETIYTLIRKAVQA